MFQSLLVEGKEPPTIQEQGEAVRLTFFSNEISASFRGFVAAEESRGVRLSVDHLLILQYLLRHAELDTATAAEVCQRQDSEVRETLSEMERDFDYLERSGTGRGRLISSGQPDRDRRMNWEAAKTRVLSILKVHADRDEPGLTNADIRRITHLDRNQVLRLMRELKSENSEISGPGRGRYAKYKIK
jgi:ATP-dependent DNA helicase RecG